MLHAVQRPTLARMLRMQLLCSKTELHAECRVKKESPDLHAGVVLHAEVQRRLGHGACLPRGAPQVIQALPVLAARALHLHRLDGAAPGHLLRACQNTARKRVMPLRMGSAPPLAGFECYAEACMRSMLAIIS